MNHCSSRSSLLSAASFLIGAFLFSITLHSCGENPVDAPKLDVAQSVDLTTQSVPSSGGSIIVDRPGDALDGLTIDVPYGAYPDARSFRISYAPITAHTFGDDMTMLTPLITIENGGEYSTDPMTVTVPVKVPSGHFAMPFLYDPSTKRLEALPLVYADSTQVRFITRHFEHSATSGLSKSAQNGSRSAIFISSTDASMLDETFDCGFKMGKDNFQFVNYGSHIAPKGHCGGQSIAAMWYYSVKKKNGGPPLNEFSDNDGVNRTPKIVYDDAAAYRFCSVVQNRMDWSSIRYYGDKSWDRDLATYRSIAFAIRETGDPQCLYVSTGDEAHAIIAYRTSAGKISVCDPNFPTQEAREIVFTRQLGDFEPYYSGENASSTGTAYFNIHHAANSALVDWEEMATLWKKVVDKTIGNDLYPAVRITARNSNNDYVPFEDGVVLPPQTTLDVSADGFEPDFRIYEFATQSVLAINTRDLQLPKGKHKLGVGYWGPSAFPGGGFIGFKWVNVEVVDEQPSEGCNVSLKIDGVPITVTSSEYYLDPQSHTLSIYLSWPNPGSVTNNSVVVRTRPEDSPGRFPGKGSYTLHYESNVVLNNMGHAYKAGTLNITRYDTRIEGSFDFSATSFGNEPYTTISVTGTVSCLK